MLLKKNIFILLMCVHFKCLLANDTIIIRKDARIDLLINKQAAINKRSSMLTSTGLYKGFRLQIISTTSREKAFQLKADLLNYFPQEKTYIMFQSPYFKVRLGNFLKREDADKFRKNLNILYPQGIFVVEDVIDYIPPNDVEIP